MVAAIVECIFTLGIMFLYWCFAGVVFLFLQFLVYRSTGFSIYNFLVK